MQRIEPQHGAAMSTTLGSLEPRQTTRLVVRLAVAGDTLGSRAAMLTVICLTNASPIKCLQAARVAACLECLPLHAISTYT